MSSFKFACAVKSASAVSVGLILQESPVDLVRDGDTWTGTSDDLTIAKTLTGSFTAKGLQGTDWAVEIDVICTATKKPKIFSDAGTVPKSGKSVRSISVDMSKNPCV